MFAAAMAVAVRRCPPPLGVGATGRAAVTWAVNLYSTAMGLAENRRYGRWLLTNQRAMLSLPNLPRAAPSRSLLDSRWTAVLAGGLVGSAARLLFSVSVVTPPGGFPVATLAVNLIGSLRLGFYLACRQRGLAGRLSVPFWGIGVLGSFTTFSTFSVEVVQLLGDSQVGPALGYVTASVVGGLLPAVVGQRIGSALR